MGTKMFRYEWMMKPTPQSAWIEGGGKFIWLALFFTETGAGLYFASLLFKSLLGMFLGWFVCLAFGGGFFLVHMGHPFRAFRAVLRPHSSWISRGVLFISSFGLLGAIVMVLSYLLPEQNFLVLKVITGILCILVAIYAGMLMSFVRAVPLWNSGMLPLSYVVAGIWSGAEILLAIHLLTGAPVEQLETWIRILLPSFTLIILLYFISIAGASKTGRASIMRMVSGDLALHFYLGILFIGLLFPIGIVLYGFFLGLSSVPAALLLIAILCGLAGDLTIRYCILKCGMYTPIV
jgi:formate-dependent nitrite reductase membrane component NrfD